MRERARTSEENTQHSDTSRLTPTQLAYKSWLSTQRPIEYHTRDDKGVEKTVLIDLLSPETHQYYDSAWNGTCTVCGADETGGVPVSKILGQTYTDWHIHKNPAGTHICKACVWSMMMNVDKGRQTLFRYSFIASDASGLKLCNRSELRDALLKPPDPPFVAVATVSQKKHLATKASIGYSRDQYPCMLEEETVWVNRALIRNSIETIEALRGLGCTKEEIQARSFRFDRLKAWGADNLQIAIDKLLPFVRSPRMFALALHVAQKNESEDESWRYMGFAPRI